MYKIKFKYPEIQRTVNPVIDNSIEQLNKAISKLYGLRIPSSFKYISEVSELNDFLKLKSKDLEKVKDWLSYTNSQYNEVINSIENTINNMGNIRIKKRNILIK